MAYSKQTWTDDVSAVTGARMTHIEQGIYDNSLATDVINPSGTATTTQTDFTEGQLTQKLGLKYIKMKGQTSQDTTTGKNLLPNILTSGSSNGITYTVNTDGTIKLNGTATADVTLFVAGGVSYESGNYFLSGCPSGGSTSTYSMVISGVARDTGSGKSFTVVSSADVRIEIKSGTSCNNLLFKPMITTGSTATTYEKYTGKIASPNPSYPQDVNNVSGSNTLKVCNKNLFDKDDTTLFYNGYIDVTSNTLKSNVNTKTIVMPCKPSTTYTISKVLSNRFITGESTTTGTNASITNTSTSASVTSHTITTSATAKYLCIFYYLSSADTLTEETIRNSIQIEVGNITTPVYMEHKEEDYNIDLPVENLFDKNNITSLNASINSSGTLSANNSCKTIIIPIKSNTTYTIQKILSTQFRATVYDSTPAVGSTGTNTQSNFNGTQITITSTANSSYLAVFCYINTDTVTYQQIIDSIQIEEGDKANAYTPYGTTPIELCKIGDYQDYLYKENNKWYKYGAINKKVLDGTENWARNDTTLGYRYRLDISDIKPNANNSATANILSNYFLPTSPDSLYNTDNYSISCFSGTSHTLIISCVNSDTNTLEKWKTWLSTHNTKVYYVLDTPTITEITYEPLIAQLDKLDKIGLYDISNISQENSDMKMLLDFTICNDNYNGLREFIRA